MQITDPPTTQIMGCGAARRAWERGGFFVFSVGKVLKEEQLPRMRLVVGKVWGCRGTYLRQISPRYN
jgi:hypothetical protein